MRERAKRVVTEFKGGHDKNVFISQASEAVFYTTIMVTRMLQSSERALPPLDLTGSALQVGKRRKQWKRLSRDVLVDSGATGTT